MQKSTALFLYLLAAQKFPVKMGTEIWVENLREPVVPSAFCVFQSRIDRFFWSKCGHFSSYAKEVQFYISKALY